MALSPRDRLRLHSLGLSDGLPDAQRRGLDVEPISGLTALAEGRLAASYSQEAKVVTARSRSVRRERIQHPPRWGPWTSKAPSTAASVSRSGLSSRMITTTHAHKALADKGGDFTGSSAGGHQP